MNEMQSAVDFLIIFSERKAFYGKLEKVKINQILCWEFRCFLFISLSP